MCCADPAVDIVADRGAAVGRLACRAQWATVADWRLAFQSHRVEQRQHRLECCTSCTAVRHGILSSVFLGSGTCNGTCGGWCYNGDECWPRWSPLYNTLCVADVFGRFAGTHWRLEQHRDTIRRLPYVHAVCTSPWCGLGYLFPAAPARLSLLLWRRRVPCRCRCASATPSVSWTG